MVVYRGVNNGLLFDLWNTYNLESFGVEGNRNLVEFVSEGIEQASQRGTERTLLSLWSTA